MVPHLVVQSRFVETIQDKGDAQYLVWFLVVYVDKTLVAVVVVLLSEYILYARTKKSYCLLFFIIYYIPKHSNI